MKETYTDKRFCTHCDKYTLHKCYDSGHERDSSNDQEECLECGWIRYGWQPHAPPIIIDDDTN